MSARIYTETKGHEWKKDEDGQIDRFVTDYYIHNGPGCIKCGYTFCAHCQKWEDIPECKVK